MDHDNDKARREANMKAYCDIADNFLNSTQRRLTSTIHEVFAAYGGPERALDRFAHLDTLLTPSDDDRLERDVLRMCFDDLRGLVDRFVELTTH